MKRGILAAVAAAVVATASLRASGYDSMRIMSFNICHCATHYSLSVTDEDVRRTASVIAAESPDFVCLQEVDDKTTRSDGIDETARLAELTGMYGTFGKARAYQGGGYGVAILSRQEPLSVSTRTVEGNEARLLLICEFDDCYIATIHFDNNRDLRLASISTVRKALSGLDKPVFISGDWNATPSSETLDAMREFVTVVSPESGVRTFGDFGGADYVIDYIAVDTADADKYYVQRGYCVSNVVDGHGSSDHNPVIVDVVRRSDAPGWVEENAVMTERTGKWSKRVVYDSETQAAGLAGTYAFVPSTPSGGNIVTMEVAATFDAVPLEETTPGEAALGAVWLGTNGCFQVWSRQTRGGDGNRWLDVVAPGVSPTPGVEYAFRFVFDNRRGAYTVAMQSGDRWLPLTVAEGQALPAGSASFPFAAKTARVSTVGFNGAGLLKSIFGRYENAPVGFLLSIR